MSNHYKCFSQVPNSVLADRLEQIIAQIKAAKNDRQIADIFDRVATKRLDPNLPVEYDHDFDLVFQEAANRLRS